MIGGGGGDEDALDVVNGMTLHIWVVLMFPAPVDFITAQP